MDQVRKKVCENVWVNGIVQFIVDRASLTINIVLFKGDAEKTPTRTPPWIGEKRIAVSVAVYTVAVSVIDYTVAVAVACFTGSRF